MSDKAIPASRPRSLAQKKAEKKNDEKRKAAPRLPSSRMTPAQGDVMDKLYEKCGTTKIDSIVEAANFYLEKKTPPGKKTRIPKARH